MAFNAATRQLFHRTHRTHRAVREKRQFWVRDGQGPCIHLQCSALKPSSGPIDSASGHLISCRVSFEECGCMFNNSQTSGGIGGHQDCTWQFRMETVSLKFGQREIRLKPHTAGSAMNQIVLFAFVIQTCVYIVWHILKIFIHYSHAFV